MNSYPTKPRGPHYSVWPELDELARQKANGNSDFDSYFVKVCELVGHQLLCLPTYERMTQDERNYWVERNIWHIIFPNDMSTFPFWPEGDVDLKMKMGKGCLMALGPQVPDMIEELERRKKVEEKEKLTDWEVTNRRSEEKFLRRQLSLDGPIKFAHMMESIRLERLMEGVEYIKNVGYFKTKENGEPRFNIKLEHMDGLKEAFYGPAGSLAEVETELGIKFANRRSSDGGQLIWATLREASCIGMNSDWQVSDIEGMLECAHEVLRFWKWCIELDHERGTTLMTLKQANDLLMKEDSKLKALWMKDTGVN